MYCILCQLHQAKGKHNKRASYGMQPAISFQTSALVEHCSGQKHQDSIGADQLLQMIRRTSIFQEKLDGASVMGSKNNGVSALLKRENPRLVNVHCICHRLALTCEESNNKVEYMLTRERLLVQLHKWLENSCVKTTAYLKMQLQLRDMQLPAAESKRHKIGHKLQRACKIRWLSTDKAVLGVWQDYTAISLTLSADEFRNDATAIGLLSQMKTMKFIGKK